MKGPTIERDPALRCKSAEFEKDGRTHRCRLTTDHGGKHLCICSRSWGESQEART